MGKPENQWLQDVSFRGNLGLFSSIFRYELFQRVLGSKRFPSFLNTQKKETCQLVNKNADKINLVVFYWSSFVFFLSTKKMISHVNRWDDFLTYISSMNLPFISYMKDFYFSFLYHQCETISVEKNPGFAIITWNHVSPRDLLPVTF